MEKRYIKQNIKYLRKKNGLKQSDLARILGYDTGTTIAKWEKGRALPPLNSIITLSEFFKVSIDDLIYTDLEVFSPLKGRSRDSTGELVDNIIEAFSHASREAQCIILDILHLDHNP